MGNREALEADVAVHPFLIGLNEHHVRLLGDCAARIHVERDHNLFREGETAKSFYLIESGQVVLESMAGGDAPVLIDTIGDCDLLGWSWLFPLYVWHFTARATKTTTAIFFYGTVLREYCEKDHTLGYELLKRMSEVMIRRLQLARGRLLKTYAPGRPTPE